VEEALAAVEVLAVSAAVAAVLTAAARGEAGRC